MQNTYSIKVNIPLATNSDNIANNSSEAVLFDEIALAINAVLAKHSEILTDDEYYDMFIVDENNNAVF